MTKEIVIDIVDRALNFTNADASTLPIHEQLEWVDAYDIQQYLFEDLKHNSQIDPDEAANKVTTLLSLHVNNMRNLIVDSILAQNDNITERDRHDLLSYVGTHTAAAKLIYIDNYANWELNRLISDWAIANDFILVYPTERREKYLHDAVVKQRVLANVHSDREPLFS